LHSSNTGGKKREFNDAVHHLFIGFKKAYDSVRREVLYSSLIELGVHLKLVRVIKMCLNETYEYSKVRTGKYLSGNFSTPIGLKEGDAFTPLIFNFLLEYAIR
jgi:hypothetical protein